MINWLQKFQKQYPEHWKNYIASFSKKNNRYVAICIETTGTDIKEDVLIGISAFAIIEDKIAIGDNFEATIMQYQFYHNKRIPKDAIVHSKLQKMGEMDGIEKFLTYLQNATLVGFNIHFITEMINKSLANLELGRLKNEAISVEIMHQKSKNNDEKYTFNQILIENDISDKNSETQSEKAFKTALLFLKLKKKLGLK